jgi:hypothetical protein
MNQKSQKPDIKIMLTRELFNSLFTMFAYFKSTEAAVGENYYSRCSVKLEAKIVRYARFFKSESGETAVVYFFTNEIMQLTDLYTKYISLREEADGDYYGQHCG